MKTKHLYLYSIKIQTNIDQNAVKYFRKITDFWKEYFEFFYFSGRAQLGPCGWAGPSWFRPASVREQFTHACYSDDVINLQVHSVCALSAKLEAFTWKQDESNNMLWTSLLSFRLFFFWFLWFLLFSVSVCSSSCGPFPFISVFSLPLCSFSFLLPATLCFLSFFHVLSSSVLPVFFLPMLSLNLLLISSSWSQVMRWSQEDRTEFLKRIAGS